MGIVEKCDEAFSTTEEGFDVDIPQNALKKVRCKPIRLPRFQHLAASRDVHVYDVVLA